MEELDGDAQGAPRPRRQQAARRTAASPRAPLPPAHPCAGPSSQDYLEALRQCYLNERFAPEILPHNSELVEIIQQLVETQVPSLPPPAAQHGLPTSHRRRNA